VSLCNNKIVFVPSCLLCPLLMAKKTDQSDHWRQGIIFYLNDKGYSIMQMPCPEASFPNYDNGISRKPHGIKYYEELVGFRDHCNKLGDQVLTRIDAFYNNGYIVDAIIGIEHSPTCAANYMYTHQGTQNRKGIFIQYIAQKIKERGYLIPIIGINRRFPNKAIQSLMINEGNQKKEQERFG